MTALPIQIRTQEKQAKPKRSISIEAYHRQYADRDDGYCYEWNNGIVEKTPRLSMNRSQLRIADFLTRLFSQTNAYKNEGSLSWEVSMFLPSANRNRVADLAYLTKEQLKEQDDLYPSISTFVIEIISKNDKADEIQLKLEQYFTDGVQVVWQVYPNQKTVHVYTSLYDVQICHGDMKCSASPALLDFDIVTKEIFN
jgi:Uma2 family endonuclease